MLHASKTMYTWSLLYSCIAYTYIYRERERERERVHIYIYREKNIERQKDR